MEPKLLGIDYGEKRIGLAKSGAFGMAHLLPVLQRKPKTPQLAIKQLVEIIKEEMVQELVVGLPKNMNNSIGFKAEEVLEFVETLKVEISLPIHLWDERLTTQQAHQMLEHLPARKRKSLLDSMSAKIILDSFLDARKAKLEQQNLDSNNSLE